ncbi:MAG: diaminopimelate decarboxylase [Anaeromicrobium sp.]|jgi:diaminopimelate decarboxylase|uniref:diaminopimelate decarboxylase n=1 Tax=Anaeromicrobium sp. TaxID=1929132 RepID=UPI0025F2A3F6|nr:diaminopimelate decarboxylase [Anaeromicrobium sp.]MCT4595673.1 diaminopimelate decarboxylase [Anaeromicrobium sp.]
MKGTEVIGSNFYFGGCDTVKLAKKYGTPLYVMSEDYICERCKEIREDFLGKYENTRAVYASKAFLTLEMCRIIEREGLGIDVVSGGELYTAIKAGFPMEKVIFHGNNKTIDEIELAVKNNVGRMVVDNLYELELLNSVAQAFGKTMKILFRITPGVDSHTHKYISTGQIDSKFGIPLKGNIINEAIKRAMDASHIELMGFHFHVGSQLFDNESHIKAVKILVELMKNMKEEEGFITKELNTGGGFGIYYAEGDEPKPLKYFTDAVMETIKEECEEKGLWMPQVIIEPGRWMVGEAGITLYTVGSIKEIPGVRTYVGINGGLPDNPRPALYDAKYEAVVANKMDQEKNSLVTIAGKCCESGDILRYDLKVPILESGDILAVKSTGAYNYSMASNYNKIPRPAVVMVKGGEDRTIVKRETYEDLLRNEL